MIEFAIGAAIANPIEIAIGINGNSDGGVDSSLSPHPHRSYR